VIIRKYRQAPTMYVPDRGEIVDARRSVADTWTRALIVKVSRYRGETLKIMVCWLGDNPNAGEGVSPIVAHTIGWIYCRTDAWLPLIRQFNGSPPPVASGE
jgi:hypothetical protein